MEFITLDGKQRFAKIILMLSAQDQKSHIRLLNDIMTIFSEQKNEEKLWGQKEILDVKNVLYELYRRKMKQIYDMLKLENIKFLQE